MKTPHHHGGHRARFRARYRNAGLDSFADHEVLELLLYYCYPRCNTNDIAHKMLKEFGTLANLFEADVQTLMQRLGCTENIAILLSLVPPLTKRYQKVKWGDKVILNNQKTAAAYAQHLFIGENTEFFYLICLNKNNRVINTMFISEGTVDETTIYPREIARSALNNHAVAVILTHNHPSGILHPSHADNEATRLIVEAMMRLNITVTDHIIIADDMHYSYAQRRHYVAGYK